MKLTIGEHTYNVELTPEGVTVDGEPFRVAVDGFGGTRIATVNGQPVRVDIGPATESVVEVTVEGKTFDVRMEGSARVRPQTPARAAANRIEAAASPATPVKGAVSAQMTGRVVRVAVQPGDSVGAGDLLLILEAMKMENEVRAPRPGTVSEVRVGPGDRVSQGDALVVIND